MNDIEKTFAYVKRAIRLSDTEMASGREELVAFMKERPLQAPVRSPLSAILFAPALRYAVAVVLVTGMGGSGMAYAATDAKPSEPLYALRVKVTEPVHAALITDDRKHADFEVQLVNERLQEVAEASVNGTLTSKQASLITHSLADHINNAQEDIVSLSADQADDALETASDLSATLSVHAAILDKVQDANLSANTALDSVTTVVAAELPETSGLVDSAQDAISTGAEGETLEQSADQQADDTEAALAQVKQDVADALASFDASDTSDVNASLAEIQAIVAQGKAEADTGDVKSAYLLYTQANQKLTALQLTLEADKSLQIDVIDATTTSPDDSLEK
jgi:hypothetical protein